MAQVQGLKMGKTGQSGQVLNCVVAQIQVFQMGGVGKGRDAGKVAAGDGQLLQIGRGGDGGQITSGEIAVADDDIGQLRQGSQGLEAVGSTVVHNQRFQIG